MDPVLQQIYQLVLPQATYVLAAYGMLIVTGMLVRSHVTPVIVTTRAGEARLRTAAHPHVRIHGFLMLKALTASAVMLFFCGFVMIKRDLTEGGIAGGEAGVDRGIEGDRRLGKIRLSRSGGFSFPHRDLQAHR